MSVNVSETDVMIFPPPRRDERLLISAAFATALGNNVQLIVGALIKERIPADRLRKFNARHEMGTQGGMLLSATVGGLTVQSLGAVPLLVFNAGTFVASALCVLAIGRRPIRPPAAPDAVLPAPVPAAARRPVKVRRLILLYAQGSVVVTVFNALLPTAVIGELGLGAGTFGVVDALGGLGFLAATGAYRFVGKRHTDLRIAVAGFLLCAVGLVLQVGRVFGLANGVGLASTAGAMFLVAAVTDHSGTRYGFAVLAAVSLLATVSGGLLLRTTTSDEGHAPAQRHRPSKAAAAGVATLSVSGAATPTTATDDGGPAPAPPDTATRQNQYQPDQALLVLGRSVF